MARRHAIRLADAQSCCLRAVVLQEESLPEDMDADDADYQASE
jgi:hypothetical protein